MSEYAVFQVKPSERTPWVCYILGGGGNGDGKGEREGEEKWREGGRREGRGKKEERGMNGKGRMEMNRES